MTPYYIEKSAVTPEEAVQIACVADGEVAFKLVPDLCRTIDKIVDTRYGMNRANWCLVLAALWMAGRVQGIREERARRKNRRKEGGKNAA